MWLEFKNKTSSHHETCHTNNAVSQKMLVRRLSTWICLPPCKDDVLFYLLCICLAIEYRIHIFISFPFKFTCTLFLLYRNHVSSILFIAFGCNVLVFMGKENTFCFAYNRQLVYSSRKSHWFKKKMINRIFSSSTCHMNVWLIR